MPAPFSPNPAERPPDPSDATADSTRPPPTHDTQGITPLASPTPLHSEPPTVISTLRPRPGNFDPKMGDALAGRKLGHFELIESVGAGGMAAVLRARDLDLGRIVALKILPPDMAADPENLVRFKQEARAAARLDHDNIARVYFFGEDQGLHFIAFEFVEGDNLRQVMTGHGGSIPIADGVALMLQVTAGLGHAAERGVVHRDIKPSNILVTPDGRAKIVDMGLARNLDPRAQTQLTESGVTLGTFDYISPEQAIDPRSADVRSDIYSLGCTFYHALTGHLPVPEGSPAQKLDAQMNQLPPDPRNYNPNIPPELAAILGRMMAKDPDRRYQDPSHLAAHLRGLARQLGIPIRTTHHGASAYGDQITRRRQMAIPWMITAVLVIVLSAVLFTRNWPWGGGDNPGPEPKGPDVVGPVEPGPAPVVVTGRRDAATTEELVALLNEGARHIRLTGSEYDLFHWRDKDGHPVSPSLVGDDVLLESDRLPTVRLGFAPDGKARAKTLTLRGPGKGTAWVRGIRFVLPDRDADNEHTGLLVTGFDRVTVEQCQFVNTTRSPRDGAAGLAVVLNYGSALVSRCYFAPGSVGLAVLGPGRVKAEECAFGPLHASVRVARTSDDLAGETELTLSHCTALVPAGGAAVEVGDQVPCIIRPAGCLFAGADRPDDPPAVFRQKRDRAEATKYEADPEAGTNGYVQIAAYAEGDFTYTFAEAAREKFPIKDTDKALKGPWGERNPFALLAATPPDPRGAFTLDTDHPDLRVRNEIIGTRYLGPDALYTAPLPSIAVEPRDATVKVWDPSLSEMADKPPGVFRTLAAALAEVRKGDTLLIRHTGRLELDPVEFTKNNTHLTIKPDPGSKPVLVPTAPILKRADGLFKLYAKNGTGRLVLDGLHFRLPAGRAPAVVVLPGGGHVEIRNCVITLDDGEDLSAVTLADPRNEMMMGTTGPAGWPLPKLTLENVFVRGRGRLMHVKGSRPFELEVKNTLAAIDGNLIDIDPSTADPSTAGNGIVNLSRTTAYLSGSLLHVRAAERKPDGPVGLARTDVTANGCLFVPAGGDVLVRAERLDSREQVALWVGWRGKDNLYGYDRKRPMLEMRPADAANSPKTLDGAGWLELATEESDPFAEVGFADKLPEAGQTRRFLGLRPTDVKATKVEPPRPEGSAEIGAPVEVPAPFPDE